MGSIYDQEQTKGIQQINKELKGSSKINKWVLVVTVLTFLAVLVQIAISIFKK